MLIFSPLFIGLFGFLGMMPFLSDTDLWVALTLVPVSLGMITLMVFGIIDAIKGKLIISDKTITRVGVLKNKTLKIEEVKGYRQDQNYIYLFPVATGLPKIKISQFYGNKGSLNKWLFKNFRDLDEIQSEEDTTEILQNPEFGDTVDDRNQKLATAQKVSKTLNAISFAMAFWVFIWPSPYQWVIVITMILPIAAFVAIHLFKGLIRVDGKQGSGYPNLHTSIIFPSMILALRAFIDYEVLSYDNFWLKGIIIAVVSAGMLLSASNELDIKKVRHLLTALVFGIIMFCYSYGALIHINCFYDDGNPLVHSKKVLSKRKSTGKHTRYYVEIKDWMSSDLVEVPVDSDLYEALDIGDQIRILEKSGKLDIPWYYVIR